MIGPPGATRRVGIARGASFIGHVDRYKIIYLYNLYNKVVDSTEDLWYTGVIANWRTVMAMKSNEYLSDADRLYMMHEDGSKYIILQSSGGRPAYLSRQTARRLVNDLLLWIATRDEQDADSP